MIRLDPHSARPGFGLAELYARYRDGLPDYHRRHEGASFVGGDGPLNAQVAVVGEAPGWREDQERRPFVGPAGKLLNEWLEFVGHPRGSVFITNVVKYRPPNNATPNGPEIAYGRPYLARELQVVSPRVVLVCGATALTAVRPGHRFREVVGQTLVTAQRLYLILYHPAACLRSEVINVTNNGFLQENRAAGVFLPPTGGDPGE